MKITEKNDLETKNTKYMKKFKVTETRDKYSMTDLKFCLEQNISDLLRLNYNMKESFYHQNTHLILGYSC